VPWRGVVTLLLNPKCHFCGAPTEARWTTFKSSNPIHAKDNGKVVMGYFCTGTCSGFYPVRVGKPVERV
jgi:hypothetical protein